MRKLCIFIALCLLVGAPLPRQQSRAASSSSGDVKDHRKQTQDAANGSAATPEQQATIDAADKGQGVTNQNKPQNVNLTGIPPIVITEKEKRWADHLFDWGPWVFALCLVIVGIFQTAAMIWQAKLLRGTMAAIKTQAELMEAQVSDARAAASETSATALRTLVAIEKQASLMEAESRTTKQAADAASKNAETSAQALTITQRAFITFVKYQTIMLFEKPNNEGEFFGFRFGIEYENVGKTPAIDAEIIFGFHKIKKGESEDIVLPSWEDREIRVPSTVAPGIKIGGLAELQPEEAEGIASGDITVFLYTQARYRDIFPDTPIHRTGTCVKLIKVADFMSGNPFQFRLHSPQYNYGD